MTTPIRSIMTSKLSTIPMGTTVPEAQRKMKELKIRHLPVVDELDDVVGILSQKDLSPLAAAEALPVEFLMSFPIHYMDQDTSVRAAAFKMLELKISSLLITNEKKDMVGIVTTEDLLWFLVHNLKAEDDGPSTVSMTGLQTIGKLADDLALMGI